MARQAERSLQLSEQGKQKADSALKKLGTKTKLAAELRMSRTTVTNFFSGRRVKIQEFQEICKELKLKLEDTDYYKEQNSREDALVQQARSQIHSYIQEKCGSMRVLDMTQSIELDDIYIHVNVLERLTKLRGLGQAELLQEAGLENFDRFCLGAVREESVPGLEAVEKYKKLMILGKPGAGKTTFLKHLAIGCNLGKFQAQRVPVFVTLKEFAEAKGEPDLLTYISQLPGMSSAQSILQAGRSLLLLDGLDEVREINSSRVLQEVQQLGDRFRNNQIVITCRIAAREYSFQRFTEVEVTDFDDVQIADFVEKWFACKQDEVKGEQFIQRLEDDKAIRELATSPLLLTMLCFGFEDTGDFPKNRSELYENGLDVLLKKWDVKRNIQRDEVYKKLSLKRKEDLLSQIAKTTFEADNYFFKQKEVERQITAYIQNLPSASTDPEALQLDSEAVLKSIEAQHGLFVERAQKIYSFSHLTFHEYFTARKIATSCDQYDADDPTLQALVNHITEKRWREVILLTVEKLESADCLLQMMKRQIDELLAEDDKLQAFLVWVNQKSESLEVPYKPAAVRAFYLDLALNCDLDRNHNLAFDLDRNLHFTSNLALNLDLDLALTLNLALNLDRNLDLAPVLDRHYRLDSLLHRCLRPNFDVHLNRVRYLDLDFDLDSFLDNLDSLDSLDNLDSLDSDLNRVLNIVLDRRLYFYFYPYCYLDLNRALDRELQYKLQQLKEQLPDAYKNLEEAEQWWRVNGQPWAEQLRAVTIEHRDDDALDGERECKLQLFKEQLPDAPNIEKLKQWWRVNGQPWAEQLRAVMIEHRNIGHDRQFNSAQKKLLKQYYAANLLLLDCLRSECYVSRAVREEIEATLLLPIAEIKNRQQ